MRSRPSFSTANDSGSETDPSPFSDSEQSAGHILEVSMGTTKHTRRDNIFPELMDDEGYVDIKQVPIWQN